MQDYQGDASHARPVLSRMCAPKEGPVVREVLLRYNQRRAVSGQLRRSEFGLARSQNDGTHHKKLRRAVGPQEEREYRTFDGDVWILDDDGPLLVLGAMGGAGEPAFSRS